MTSLTLQHRLRPIVVKGTGTQILTFILGCGTMLWLYFCGRIISLGLTTLGIDTFGAVWGILVVNTVHMIGISHVGIAISAAVRLLRLERWRNVARMAEFVTLIALLMAAVNLLLHVGRPGRFLVNPFLFGRWHSPQVWSMTVFTLYFMASSAYLYLSMRRDLAAMGENAPRFRGAYRLLAWGYRDCAETRERHDRTLFWLALCLIPIMISVHSVYGLLFGMISAKAGWYNTLQAPYFVLGAIVSGFSTITFLAAVLRHAYSWRNLLTDRLFREMGGFLAFVVFLYLYFMLSEHLTAQYLPTAADNVVSSSLLFGRFSVPFWLSSILGLLMPFAYLLYQAVTGKGVRAGLIAAAALLMNAALWIKRYLLIISSQYFTHMSAPRPHTGYVPTGTEWMATLGTYVAGALAFVLLLRLLPMFELSPGETGETRAARSEGERVPARTAVMLLSLLAGTLMILWGVLSRESDFAPLKWIAGFAMLAAIPLESCIIGARGAKRFRMAEVDIDSISSSDGAGR